MQTIESCAVCKGTGWTCEDHPMEPFEHGNCKGAGDPCEWCNGEEGPRNPEGFIIKSDKDGVRH